MTEQIDPICLFDNPPLRRLWLLIAAVRSLPFDRAVEFARMAEAFVTGSAAGASVHHEAVSLPIAPSDSGEQPSQISQIGDPARSNGAILADRLTERAGLALSNDERDRLLERLAKGIPNAELAAEFGISRKQVQGLRMGCAREIARRRAQPAEKRSDQSLEDRQNPAASASIEEIVRYLRQQDDVVVPQEDGGYMVNGRFRLSAAELVERANRMRSRQRKPSFHPDGGPSSGPAQHSNRIAEIDTEGV